MRFSKILLILIGSLAIGAHADSLSLLWFGNSFSDAGAIYNNIPNMINGSYGVTENLTIDSLLPKIYPSCWLDCHETQWPAFAVIDSGHFDLVVAQDNTWGYTSTAGLSGKGNTLTTWANHAKGAGGVLVIEQMWMPVSAQSTQTIQNASDFWYDSVARSTNSIMAPCGWAWWRARQTQPNLEYIAPNWNDGVHPGSFGAYLNQCVFYATLTGVSPVGLTYKKTSFGTDVVLSDASALFAQQTAWEAYQYFYPASNLAVTNYKATPAIVVQNGTYSIVFSATVTGTNPITSVMLDLGALNGPANVAMTANASVYSYTYTFPQGVSLGTKSVSIRATDNAGNYLIRRIPFKVEKPLALLAAKALHYPTRVSVFFSEILDRTTAAVAANYSIDHGVTISAASVDADSQTVTLTTSALSAGVNYTLTVNNVKDDAASTIPNNTAVGFVFNPLTQGVQYKYYEAASFTGFSEIAALTPRSTGVNPNFNLDPATAGTNYALVFTGLINIPAFGTYTFYTTADDVDEIYINDALIVGTNYSSGEKSNVVKLTAGFHKIKVQMFQNCCGELLTLSWSGPSIAKAAIPDSVLFYDQLSPTAPWTKTAAKANPRTVITRSSSGDILITSGVKSDRVSLYTIDGATVAARFVNKGSVLVLPKQSVSPGLYIIKIVEDTAVTSSRVRIGM